MVGKMSVKSIIEDFFIAKRVNASRNGDRFG